MKLTLFRRRTVWCPTLTGWILLGLFGAGAVSLWWFYGEDFFSVTDRQPATVLVVEAWIGTEGMRAAVAEAREHGETLVVTSGGLSSERWSEERFSYAEMARRELIRSGLPADQVVAAPSVEVETQRTFETAAAAWRLLQATGSPPRAINVFTRSVHARRSRLVFAKVFSGTKVGIIGWKPARYATEPWWRVSERADDLMKETIACTFEALLNCGRHSNSPVRSPQPASP